MKQLFEAVEEGRPGPKWRKLFHNHWPAYREPMHQESGSMVPTLFECRRALQEHMPLWKPIWDEQVECVGGGDAEARFLSMWCPAPAVFAGTQAFWLGSGGPALLHNHDQAIPAQDVTWLSSRWGGQRVVAVTDHLCGALDGLNESGLAVALSFGGRKVRGAGFGAQLIVRYLLEFAGTTREAAAMLSKIPVSMTHSITLVDRLGNGSTVFVAPDREALVVPLRGIANHQHAVEWPEYAVSTQSRARCQALDKAIAESSAQEEMIAAMLTPPLYQRSSRRGHGTLYTAIYRPDGLRAELIWPTGGWVQSIHLFEEGVRHVALFDGPRGGATERSFRSTMPGELPELWPS
ncbi:hypothetical protein HLB44_12570 [Aquincola sp. S2]|uniref:Peptidase C45 hydrolase domain-containing protein n=1 Tax=Pseudaquabacterium terrae TaxID=2732868 RepID=A0ABX2EGR9_9BURK|nr:C45 family peptidase [Aquabacterium terrae]NRF67819.1 hypothetical protein [Aquabacterium terrae]